VTISTSIVPGTELFFTDSASGLAYALPTDTLVGSEPVFTDDSDATYADLALVHGTPLGTDVFAGQRMYGRLEAVTLPARGLSVSFRTDQVTTDVGLGPPFFLNVAIFDKGAGSTEDDFGASMIWVVLPEIAQNSDFTTYIADLTIPLSNPRGRTLADLLDLIAAGDAWVSLGNTGTAASGLFSGKIESRVSEFSIFAQSPAVRLQPRDDEDGIYSAPRLWPPARAGARLYGSPP
jgi:hypothetical protein